MGREENAPEGQVSTSNDDSLQQRMDRFAGSVLGHLRRAEGMTQEELAEALKMPGHHVKAWKAGARSLDLDSIYAIAVVLNIDPRDFVIAVGEYFFQRDKPKLKRADGDSTLFSRADAPRAADRKRA